MPTSRQSTGKPADRSSTTDDNPSVDLVKPGRSDSPHMPHERDESVGATDGIPSKRVRQGHQDLKRGVQDTSRAPEADRAYDKLKK